MFVLAIHTLYSVAIGIGLISLLAVMSRLIGLRRSPTTESAWVSIILPLTGEARAFSALLDALNKQTLRPACLVVSVESEHDPAYARVRSSIRKARFPIKLVVAGPAAHQAQKCRNQQAALDHLDVRTEVIVLMDGDIVPDPDWLSSLISPVVAGEYDIISGHRWQQIARHRLGAHLVAATDRATTLLPRVELDFACVTWGGSIAMTIDVAQWVDLRSLFDRVLSDDLALARRASWLGLRVGTHRSLLVPSPNEQSFASAWHFARRQYQMCRIYRTTLWSIGLGAVGLRLAGWSAALLVAVIEDSGVWVLQALMLLGLLKQYVIGEFSRRLGMPDAWSVRLVQLGLGCCQPIVDLFHLSAIIGASWVRTVRWGHVTYRVFGPDSIQVQERDPFHVGRRLERPDVGTWDVAKAIQSGADEPR